MIRSFSPVYNCEILHLAFSGFITATSITGFKALQRILITRFVVENYSVVIYDIVCFGR
jgi:hypothetical protein